MKRFIVFMLLLLVVVPSVQAAEPELQTGDIVFQTSSSTQSYAIMWASKSLFSHVGIVELKGRQIYVIEAIATVRRTPLKEWIKRGRFGRYAVFRFDNLTDQNKSQIVAAAKDLIGRKYDLFFTLGNNEIYCSELVEIAYEKAGVSLGNKQKIKDLDVDNALVRALVKKRWRQHPLCKGSGFSFDVCWSKILEDEIVTPYGLTKDGRLREVWTNYP